MLKRLFIYACKVASITAGATSTQTINISNDTSFELRELRTKAVDGVFITVSYATGEQMSNIPINSNSIGVGNNGLKLFDPVILPQNTQLTVLIENTTGGTVTNFDVNFIGYKL